MEKEGRETSSVLCKRSSEPWRCEHPAGGETKVE